MYISSLFIFFNSIFYTFGYNCIYIFSFFQIKLSNIYKKIKNANLDEYTVELFNSTNNSIRNVNLNILKNENFEENYIIVKNNKLNLIKFINKKCLANYDFSKLEWKKTKYSFISSTYCDVNKIIKILDSTLTNGNYFCVGNFINYNFIKYYMIKHHNIIVDDNFIISIMDDNLKKIDVKFDKNNFTKILLNEKMYNVIEY